MNPTPTLSAANSLKVPGARLHYEIRGNGPLLAVVGAPMGADSFAALAEQLATDHTVLTTDPRGTGRSPQDDPDQDSTPELRADDLSRLLAHLDSGPAAVLGSSGGAVTVLALAQAQPKQVHTVIAHEPPLIELLDDHDQLHAGTESMIASHHAGDVPGAWAQFFTQANITMPPGATEMMFGGDRDPQVVVDERFWFAHELRGTTHFAPDIAALRSVPARIVVGIGNQSSGQLCDRSSRTLAERLGIEPTMFPGGHIAFIEDADGFAARLRAVLNPS